MKYRVIRELKPNGLDRWPEYRFFIQTAELDKWLGTAEWKWLTYPDDEGVQSRYRFQSDHEAINFIKLRLKENNTPIYDVVWTQP